MLLLVKFVQKYLTVTSASSLSNIDYFSCTYYIIFQSKCLTPKGL